MVLSLRRSLTCGYENPTLRVGCANLRNFFADFCQNNCTNNLIFKFLRNDFRKKNFAPFEHPTRRGLIDIEALRAIGNKRGIMFFLLILLPYGKSATRETPFFYQELKKQAFFQRANAPKWTFWDKFNLTAKASLLPKNKNSSKP
ncbi:MAG: hypothetical protein LBO71_01905 [Prevotellaceae bacterium]|nr:hypothetical protein [Prevotellaceae bacterium]